MNSSATVENLIGFFYKHFPTVQIVDLRGTLPTHESKKYKTIGLEHRIGLGFHHAAGWATIFDYAEMHIAERDWPGIAYTLVIDADGTLSICWDFGTRTYAMGWKDDASVPETIGDENAQYIGVLVNGFFSSHDYPHSKGSGEPTA